MSQSGQTFLFFIKPPNLQNLISFSVEIPYHNQENNLSAFHRRVLKCRELIFSEAEIVATPENFSENRITAVIPKIRFYSSEFKHKLEKMGLKILNIDAASPSVLQECLQYTARAKLAPNWNCVQNFLVQGRDFLTSSDPLRTIKMDIFVTDSEISLCVKPACIRLPHFKIENYINSNESSQMSVKMFENCYVLPSLKRGKAVLLSRSMLKTNLLKNYSDLKKHWKNMYGYRLPDIPEQHMWYLNIMFHVKFSPVLTYPFFCVRSFGMIEVPRVDPHLTLRSFIGDFCKKVDNICKEKCQILDRKASFPLLHLYPASDVTERTGSKIGTTYNMMQNLPYRSCTVSRTSNENPTNKTKQCDTSAVEKLTEKYMKSNGDSRVTSTNFLRNPMTETLKPVFCTTSNSSCNQNLDKTLKGQVNQQLKNNSFQREAVQNSASSNCDNHGHPANISIDMSNSKKISNENSGNNRILSLQMQSKDISTECQMSIPQKYAPKFFPKKPKLAKILTLPDMFAKTKSPKYVPNFSAAKRNFPLDQKPCAINAAASDDFQELSHSAIASSINGDYFSLKTSLTTEIEQENKFFPKFERKSVDKDVNKRKRNKDETVAENKRKKRKNDNTCKRARKVTTKS